MMLMLMLGVGVMVILAMFGFFFYMVFDTWRKTTYIAEMVRTEFSPLPMSCTRIILEETYEAEVKEVDTGTV